jgi:predicted lipase
MPPKDRTETSEASRGTDRADGALALAALTPKRFEKDAVGNSYDDLAVKYENVHLPAKYDESRSFNFHPVHPQLKQLLVNTEQHPDPDIAHALATCAAYSYSDSDTLSMIMTRMGLHRNRCHVVSETVDAMLIDSTAFLVESDDGEVVILSYRGTQPLSLLNWLVSLNVDRKRAPLSVGDTRGQFDVHSGFYRNVRATRHKVIDSLIRALRDNDSVVKDSKLKGRSLKELQALYITGHSLGGAMAALMAVMLLSEPKYEPIAEKLKAVYTFGQPMIGSPDFAAACQGASKHDYFLKNKVLRYVYEQDLVPALPPKANSEFAHFGQELKYDAKNWTHQDTSTPQVNDLELIFAARAFYPFLTLQVPLLGQLSKIFPFSLANRLFPYSLENHLPEHYVTALARDNMSEFGDEY